MNEAKAHQEQNQFDPLIDPILDGFDPGDDFNPADHENGLLPPLPQR